MRGDHEVQELRERSPAGPGQASYRKRHQQDRLVNVEVLTRELAQARERIAELEAQVDQLDVREFKAWLRSQPPSPFVRKLLDKPPVVAPVRIAGAV
jgi:hypothetical protein